MVFRIHNLIELRINTGIGERIINTVEFQLEYFKVDNPITKNSCPVVVTVSPLEKLKVSSDCPTCEAERNSYIHTGSSFVLTEKGFAIRKTTTGFDLYVADNGLIPINMILQLLLVDQGVSMVHAAGVERKGGGVVLLPSFAAAGKTSLLGGLVRKGGYRILGDDVVLLNQYGMCLCYPRKLVLKAYNKDVFPELFEKLQLSGKRTKLVSEVKRLAKENMPFRGILRGFMPRAKVRSFFSTSPYLKTVPLEEAFGKGSIVEKGNIDKIIFLQRYSGSEIRVGDIDEQALNNRLFSIIHLEWLESSLLSPLIGAAFGLIDLAGYFEKMAKVLSNAVRGKKRRIVWIPSSANPDELTEFMQDEVEKD